MGDDDMIEAFEHKIKALKIKSRELKEKITQIRTYKTICPACNVSEPDPQKWNSIRRICLVCFPCYKIGHPLELESPDEIKEVLELVAKIKAQRAK